MKYLLPILLLACGAKPTAPNVRDPLREHLAAIAQYVIHGEADKDLGPVEMRAKIDAGEIVSTTCGRISALAIYELTQLGYKARPVGTFTLEPRNGYDDGHRLFEVYYEGVWGVWDLDNNLRPLKNQRPITLPELVELVQTGEEYELDVLATGPSFDLRWEYYEEFASPEWNVLTWYERVLQVPGVYVNEQFYFEERAETDQVLEYGSSLHAVSAAKFNEFYQTY